MSEASNLSALLSAHTPVAAAQALGDDRARPVLVRRGSLPADWFQDGHRERPVAEHRAAHAAGRPSQAALVYGHGVPPERVAARLAELAAAAADGLLAEVWTVPAEGSTERPGSWGVEDLTVVTACRTALPETVAVFPSWHHLGAAACQVAVEFGASGWRLPEDDDTDLERLAAAIGRGLQEEPSGGDR